MADDYAYPVDQCDAATERHAALQSYRDKRRLWLSWIDTDEHHAVWRVLSSMVWTDVSFKVLTHFATNRASSPAVDGSVPAPSGASAPRASAGKRLKD
jgi:hypothetical protein